MKKRILSVILALSLVLSFVPAFSITSFADQIPEITVAVDNDSTYGPSQIINGGFESSMGDGVQYHGVDGGWNTTEVDYCFERFDMAGGTGTYGIVNNGTGHAVEMNNWQAAALYQDISTKGGDVILWTLDHAARDCGDDPQTMQVTIGASDGNIPTGVYPSINTHITAETKAVYTYNNIENPAGKTYGYGKAEELANLSVPSLWYDNPWYTAKGIYLVPEGQTVTRFAFESLCDEPGLGNLLDNVTFSTLIGNLSGYENEDGSATVKGYWGDADAAKKLCIKIGDTVYNVDMQSVLNKNFIITIPAEIIGDESVVDVYHQDYENAKRTIKFTPAVTLNGAAPTDGTTDKFTYPDAKVSGYVKNIMITVDTGSFTVPGYTAFVTDLTGLSKTYSVSSADEAEAILRAAEFTLAAGEKEQKVTVSVSGNEIDFGGETVTVTQMNAADGTTHYYGFVKTGEVNEYGDKTGNISFSEAYAGAKSLTFNGLKGYLATITSASETDVLDKITDWFGWGGGARVTVADASLDGDTFTNAYGAIGAFGATWYWVCGPEAGTALQTLYEYWTSGEPNGGTEDYGEYCLMLHFGDYKRWNDVDNNLGMPGYFVEWSEDTRDSSSEKLFAEAEDTLKIHVHGECGDDECTSEPEIIWTAWTSGTALPTDAGYYYLTSDVTLASSWKKNADVHICLNGHTVNGLGSTEVTDCQTIGISLGTQQWMDEGVYRVPATVSGKVRTVSIVVTNAKLKLTKIAEAGSYEFRYAVVNSTTSHTTPDTNTEYVSVQLVAESTEAVEEALGTIRYTSLEAAGAKVEVTASTHELMEGDYYIDGHYYTLSESGSMSWEEGMEWAYNLMSTDSERYAGYKSYPVVITSTEENQMLVNIWNNNGSDTKRQIFLPAIPVNPTDGTIVVSGSIGNIDVIVTGEPKCSDVYKYSYGHGEVWKWMDGTPEAGNALPQENGITGDVGGTYWAASNPTDGGMVYFGHPTLGAYWDDLTTGGQWGSNVWTTRITNTAFSGHIYALAEWEPTDGVIISATKNLVIHTHTLDYEVTETNEEHDTVKAVASCIGEDGCKLTDVTSTATAVISAVSKTYDGVVYSGATLTLDNWTENGIETPVIFYEGRGETEYASSAIAPTDAGTYYAEICVEGKTAYVEFTIDPIPAEISEGSSSVEIPYGSNIEDYIPSSASSNGIMYYAISSDGINAPEDGWTTEIPSSDTPGTYFIWYKFVGDKNYASTEPANIEVTFLANPDTGDSTVYVLFGAAASLVALGATVVARRKKED